MWMFNNLNCCGVREGYTGGQYRTVVQVVKDMVAESILDSDGPHCGAVLFTDIGRNTAAKRALTELTKAKLGTVTAAPEFVNPNTGNKIRSYLWTINKRNLKAFAKRNNLLPKEDSSLNWW